MKKIFTILILVTMLALCITGCACEHEWLDANCQAPMTCKLCDATNGEELGDHVWIDASCDKPKHCEICGITEGETLEHNWAMPTCTTPKTCMVCGATEGEALGHEMTEANYQTPATCKNCGYTESETQTPDAVLHDLHITNAEMNIRYDYTTSCRDNPEEKTIGKLTLSSHEVFESADGYEAMDGYEWHSVNVEIIFNDENAWKYGFDVITGWGDYYMLDKWGNENQQAYTVNYNGIVYDQCVSKAGSATLSGWNPNTRTNAYYCNFAWRVPVGYDGYLLYFYDANTEYESGQYIYEFLTKDNALILRFNSETATE